MQPEVPGECRRSADLERSTSTERAGVATPILTGEDDRPDEFDATRTDGNARALCQGVVHDELCDIRRKARALLGPRNRCATLTAQVREHSLDVGDPTGERREARLETRQVALERREIDVDRRRRRCVAGLLARGRMRLELLASGDDLIEHRLALCAIATAQHVGDLLELVEPREAVRHFPADDVLHDVLHRGRIRRGAGLTARAGDLHEHEDSITLAHALATDELGRPLADRGQRLGRDLRHRLGSRGRDRRGSAGRIRRAERQRRCGHARADVHVRRRSRRLVAPRNGVGRKGREVQRECEREEGDISGVHHADHLELLTVG